eukprot:1281995-Amphidinium_carterae.2
MQPGFEAALCRHGQGALLVDRVGQWQKSKQQKWVVPCGSCKEWENRQSIRQKELSAIAEASTHACRTHTLTTKPVLHDVMHTARLALVSVGCLLSESSRRLKAQFATSGSSLMSPSTACMQAISVLSADEAHDTFTRRCQLANEL